MIYINAKAGQDVKITQAISVATPADYLAKNMQLFKGEEKSNGTINWTEPATFPENKQLSSVDQGQVLFQGKCASCHAIDKPMTGPALAHIIKRFGNMSQGEGNYRYFEHGFYPYRGYFTLHKDSVKKDRELYFRRYDLPHYDPFYTYKCNLVKQYGSVGPIMFNDTSTNDYIDEIYRYIQNESDRRNLDLPSQASLMDCADSCALYMKTLADLREKKSAAASKRKGLIKDNGSLVEQSDTVPGTSTAPGVSEPVFTPPLIDFDAQVSPKNYDAEYYQFTIETFGWYNIDILLKDVDGVEDSELFVRVTGQYKEKIKIYLILPSIKVNAEGGPTDRNPDEYAFYQKDGKLPLPQNVKASILAVTETEGSIAFALKEFTTSRQQVIEVSLGLATKEEFTTAVQAIDPNNRISVSDTKNAEEIRKTDNEIKNFDKELKNAEKHKPKNCDCDCGPQAQPVSISTEVSDFISTPKS